ncbi:MAG: RidA family protein [Elusimicrobiota bacterium]|jgi:2-iminobutanoate/2-iminopropanoate deaminase|nr:RidA family protein [Elusimicrobiota bacterium]
MGKKIIETNSAPKAIGPYSQAVRNGSWAFISGCLPSDPITGALVGGDIRTQTRRVLENMKEVLKACKMDFKNVLKTTVFVTNLADFADMNEIYGEFFKENPPARSTVQVAALPKGALVEIEAVARK